ncbi:unnamed protein product [Amoebophrya sp. A120]|nr:unnamed protein product [Amoebophrya sp. A120]|eukprot:GSA120T00001942001.1
MSFLTRSTFAAVAAAHLADGVSVLVLNANTKAEKQKAPARLVDKLDPRTASSAVQVKDGETSSPTTAEPPASPPTVDELQDALELEEEKLKNMALELTVAKTELGTLQTEKAALQADKAALEQQIAAMPDAEAIVELQTNLTAALSQIDHLLEGKQNLTDRLEAATAALEATAADLQTEKDKVITAQTELAAAEAAAADWEKKFKKLKTQTEHAHGHHNAGQNTTADTLCKPLTTMEACEAATDAEATACVWDNEKCTVGKDVINMKGPGDAVKQKEKEHEQKGDIPVAGAIGETAAKANIKDGVLELSKQDNMDLWELFKNSEATQHKCKGEVTDACLARFKTTFHDLYFDSDHSPSKRHCVVADAETDTPFLITIESKPDGNCRLVDLTKMKFRHITPEEAEKFNAVRSQEHCTDCLQNFCVICLVCTLVLAVCFVLYQLCDRRRPAAATGNRQQGAARPAQPRGPLAGQQQANNVAAGGVESGDEAVTSQEQQL